MNGEDLKGELLYTMELGQSLQAHTRMKGRVEGETVDKPHTNAKTSVSKNPEPLSRGVCAHARARIHFPFPL